MTVGKRIRDARKIFNLTQSELAKKVNVSAQVISNWERGYTKPNSEDIQRIASILDISTEYLYGRTNDPSSSTKSHNDTYDPLAIIKDYITKKGGAEQFGFFDIEEWKDLTPAQVEDVLQDFEYMFQRAKKRNEEKE